MPTAKPPANQPQPERGTPERIAATCRQAVAGKLALRELAIWVASAGADISEAEFLLLWVLFVALQEALGEAANDAQFNQAELAERLVASPAHVSGAVERLRARGLIEARIPDEDRRRQQWRLTLLGVHQIEVIIAAVEGLLTTEAPAAMRRDAA